jgi:DNA-binding Lrp family transcriptional regulator
MLSKTDMLILSHLRRNARETLVSISRKTKIPVSTIFDRLSKLEELAVTRYVSLIDFSKLSHNIAINYVIRSVKDKRQQLFTFLSRHPNINSVYRTNNGFDLMLECVFMELKQKEAFEEELDSYVHEKKEFHVIEEIKREEFLASPQDFGRAAQGAFGGFL